MPNGHDKNWFRLCGALDGFRVRYGRWPVRVQMHRVLLGDLESLFTPEDFARISSKVELVAGEGPMIAEGDAGASYNYNEEGFPQTEPVQPAKDWLGVEPKPEEDE